MAEGDIDNLTMEQYLALTRGNQAPGVVKPEIAGNVNFKIKSQFMRELQKETFSGNKNDDAHEHVERILDIVSLFNIPGVTHDAVMLRVFPITLTGAAKRWGPIPGMTHAQDLTAIQTMTDHSQKWHDDSSSRNIDNSRAHLDKECPLNKEVKSVEEVKYGEFGRSSPFSNGAKYRVGLLGYYTRIDNRPPFGEKRPSLEELISKHLEESTRRRAEMEE
ncbi:hypothetical protein Tco_0172608 [Tanacetum coccineum]